MEEQGQQPAAGPGPVPRRRGYRSLFWAIVLLGVGVYALLLNLDVVPAASLGMLTYVWPIIIIGVAVDLIVGRRSLVAGALVGVLTVGVILTLMLVGPEAGWTGNTELKTQVVDVPVEGATNAQVTISTGGYSADIHALPASTVADRQLLHATIAFRGALEWSDSSGSSTKVVNIAVHDQQWWWPALGLRKADTWDVGLDPQVPLDLKVESSSGAVQLHLSSLKLTALGVQMSSGDMDIDLPALDGAKYAAALKLSSGDMEVRTAPGSRLDMSLDMSSGDVRVGVGSDCDLILTFNGSSGQFTVDLASGQAARLEVRSVSSGDVKVPAGLAQVSWGDGKEGVWETTGFATAAHKVVVIIEHMSSGSARLNQAG
jgi:hypothetical protein